jgi:magnesium transporter
MHLLGRITIDDVVDLIKEEAERDYQLASGISESVEADDTVWRLTRARLPWLLIGMFGGVMVAQVIGIFEAQLAQVAALMLFVPLIAAMGGNVGVQSSAIVVQGLANKSFTDGSIFFKLLKELAVGTLNGFICAVVILIYGIIFLDSMALSYTVSTALFAVVIIAAMFGTIVPLLLDKLKIDPALATGPFITTVNDIIGLSVYFLFAKLFFHI